MMPRGGRRPGAGRVTGTGNYGEPTKVMRVPASMVETIKRFIKFGEETEPTCPFYVQDLRYPKYGLRDINNESYDR
jgi:hypothetical protein